MIFLQLLDLRNDMESSRRFKEVYLTMDDEEEDSPGNSNAVETKLKVPPDKLDGKISNSNKVPVKSKVDMQSESVNK